MSTASPLFVNPKKRFRAFITANLLTPVIECLWAMLKRNLSVILVVLLTLLLMALVIWVYEKRIREIKNRMHTIAWNKSLFK